VATPPQEVVEDKGFFSLHYSVPLAHGSGQRAATAGLRASNSLRSTQIEPEPIRKAPARTRANFIPIELTIESMTVLLLVRACGSKDNGSL
jgi:hypothetical protein